MVRGIEGLRERHVVVSRIFADNDRIDKDAGDMNGLQAVMMVYQALHLCNHNTPAVVCSLGDCQQLMMERFFMCAEIAMRVG